MPAPLLVPGLCVLLGAASACFWSPEPRACVAWACLALPLAMLPGRTAVGATWLAWALMGAAAAGLVRPGPELSGFVDLRGRVTVGGGRPLLATSAGPVMLQGLSSPLAPGTALAVFGRAGPLHTTDLPGAPSPARDAVLSGARSRVRVQGAAGLPARTRPFAHQRHEGLLHALAFGDRSHVPEALDELLQRTGTRHLLAISGLHLGLVAGLAGLVARWMLAPLALVWRRGGLSWIGALVAVAAAWWLAERVGWPSSTRRAFGMVAAAVVAVGTQRGVSTWNVLGAACGVGVLLEPSLARDAGFLLSLGAVAGIASLGQLVAPALHTCRRPFRWLGGLLIANLGAQLGTLPVAAWIFQDLPVAAPAANLVAVPLAGVLVPAALLGVQWPQAARFADGAAEVLIRWLQVCEAPVLHPAVGPLGAAGLAVALLVLARAPGATLVLGALSLALRPLPPPDQLRVTVLAVGQGDATLVELPRARRLLVDGGPSERAVVDYLRRVGVRRLDEVALTHPHPDHMRGLQAVIEELEVAVLRVPRAPADEPAFAALVEAARRRGTWVVGPDAAALPGVRVLHPSPGFLASEPDLNEGSLVLEVEHGATRVLLTGDIERSAERALAPTLRAVSLLKVAHHGSRTSSHADFLAATSPLVAVVPVGRGNAYGHPVESVLARFPGLVLRTDLDGTVELTSDGHRSWIRRYSHASGWSEGATLPSWREPP